LDLAGGTILIIRRLIVPLTLALMAHAGQGLAQDAFPPPQQGECMQQFLPLREDAEQRGKLIKAASERHASPQEACKLIGSYGQAETKMIKYIETNASKCGIPSQIQDQLKESHENTEKTLKQVCNAAAQQQQQGGPAGPLGDYWLPEEQL
jgi:hypothetical protein